MARAPEIAAALAEARQARHAGGIALFGCPRHRGSLRLTPGACAKAYRLRAAAKGHGGDHHLEPCARCPVGAANAAALQPKRKAGCDEAVLNAVRSMPGLSTAQLATRLHTHVGAVHARLAALNRRGAVTTRPCPRAHQRAHLDRWWPA